MSYEDTNCPCGDRKPTDTMLCDACMADLAERREMAIFRSAEPIESRRHAATILLALARGRKRRMANILLYVKHIGVKSLAYRQ